ncbi:MAG: hypothetical protein IT371_16300 [Deltaproteobacteria bacterium]|nr:hypothetical protein [Deltaproteobacteria bacterium]
MFRDEEAAARERLAMVEARIGEREKEFAELEAPRRKLALEVDRLQQWLDKTGEGGGLPGTVEDRWSGLSIVFGVLALCWAGSAQLGLLRYGVVLGAFVLPSFIFSGVTRYPLGVGAWLGRGFSLGAAVIYGLVVALVQASKGLAEGAF